MSGQRSRKVRMGSSRRKTSKQKEKSDPDDGILKTQGLLTAEHSVAEESSESLADFAEPNYSQAGSQTVAEVTGNRRKLGSSRKIKDRKDVKDSAEKSYTSQYSEMREEVYDNTPSKEEQFDKSSKSIPSILEMESASYQEHDFVQPPDLYYKQPNHLENLGEETGHENKDKEQSSTLCSNEMDTVTLPPELIPQYILSEQREPFGDENREVNKDNILEQREIIHDEETIQNESKWKIAAARQDERSPASEHDSSVSSSNVPEDSFEFGTPTTTSCADELPDCLIHKSEEALDVDGNDDDNTLKGMEPSVQLQSEEVSDHVETYSSANVVGQLHQPDDANGMHDQVTTTQIKEMEQHQLEQLVKSDDQPVISDTDNKQGEDGTTTDNLGLLYQGHETATGEETSEPVESVDLNNSVLEKDDLSKSTVGANENKKEKLDRDIDATQDEIANSGTLDLSQNASSAEHVVDSSHLSDTKSHEEDYDKDSPDTAEHVSEHSWASKSDSSDAHRGHQGILDQHDKNQNDENPQITSTGKRRKMGSTRRLQPKKAISDQGATMEFDTTDVNVRNQKSFEGELNVISEPKYDTSNTTVNMDLTLIGTDSQSHDINTSHNKPMDTPVEVESLDNTNDDDVEKSLMSTVRDGEETKDDKSETDSINMDSTLSTLLYEQDEDVTETTLREKKEVEEILDVIEEANALQSEKTPLMTLSKPNESKESFASEYASDQFDIHSQDNTESIQVLTAAVGSASHSEDVGNNALVDQDSTMASTTKHVRERPEEENLGHGSDEKQKIDVDVSEVAKNVGDAIMVETSPAEYQLQLDVECKYDESEEQREKPCEAVMDSSHSSDTKSHEEDYDKDSPDTAEHVSEHSWASKSDASDAHRGHQGIVDQHDQSQNDENPQKTSTGKRRKMGSTRRLQPKKAISDQGATMEFDTTDVNMGNQKSFEGELNVISEPIYNTSNTAGNMDLTLIGSDSQSHDINTSHNEPMDTAVEVEPLDNTNDDVEKSLSSRVRDSEETIDDKYETDRINMDSTVRNLLDKQAEDVTETTLRVEREVEERFVVIEEDNAFQSEKTLTLPRANSEVKESFASQYQQGVDASDQFDIDLQDNTESMKVFTGAVGSASHSENVGNNVLVDQDLTMASTTKNVRERPEEENLGHGSDEKQKIDVDISEVAKNVGDASMVETSPAEYQLQFDVECKYDESEEQREKPCEAVMDSSHLHDINTSHNEPMDTPVEVEPLEKSLISRVRDSEETKDDKSETDSINMDSTFSTLLAEQDEDVTETTLREMKEVEEILDVIEEANAFQSEKTSLMTLSKSHESKESFASQYHQGVDASDQFDIHSQDNTESMKDLTGAVGGASHSEDVGNDALVDQDSTVMASTYKNVSERPEEENLGHGRDEKQKIDVDVSEVEKNMRDAIMVETSLAKHQLQFDVECKYDESEEQREKPCEAVMDSSHLSDTKSHEEDYDKDSPDTAEHVSEHSWASKSDASDAHRGHQGILDQHDEKQNDENPQITSTGKRRKMGSTRRLQPKKAISDQGITMEFDTTDVNMGNQKSFEGELNVISEPKYDTSNTTVNMDLTLIGSDSQSHDINKSHNEPMDTPVEVESLDNTNDEDVEKLLISRVRDGEETKDDKSETDMNMDSTLSNLLDEQDEDVTETTLREMKEVEEILDVTEEANALQSEKTPFMALSKPNESKESFASQYHQGVDASDQFDIHSQDNSESIKVLTGAVGGASHSEDVGNDALLDQDSTVMASTSKNVSELPQEENLGHGSDEKQKIDVDVSEVEKNVGDAIMVETSPAEYQLQFDPQITSTGKRRKMGSTRRLQPKKAISDQGATMEFDTTDVNMRNEKSVEGELNLISEPIYNTSNTAGNMDLTLIGSDNQSHDVNTSHNEPMDTPVEVETLDNTNDDVEKSLMSRVRDSEETIDDKSDTDSINMDSTVRNLLDKQDEDVTETTLGVEREVEERFVVIEEANALQSEKTPLMTLPRANSEVKESFASQYHQGVDASDQFDIDLQDNTESMKVLTGAVGSASHSEDVGNNALVDQDSTMASTTKNVRERPEEESLGHGSDEKQKIDVDISEVEKNVRDAIMVETSPAEYQLQLDVECKYGESEEQREKPCEAVMDSSHLHDINTSHNEPMDTPVEVEPLEKSLISRVRDSEETKDDKSETDSINMDSTFSTLLAEQDEDVTETTLREMKEVEEILDVIEEANAFQSEKTPLMTSSRPNSEIDESFASQYHQGVDASDQFDIHLQDNTESMKVLTGTVGSASHSEDVGNYALLDQDSTVMASTYKNVSERPQEENLGHGSDEVQKIDVDVSEVEKNVRDAIMVETSPAEYQLQFDVECKYDESEEQREKPCEAVMDSSHSSDTKSHEEDYDKDSPDTAEHVSEHSWASKSDASDAHRGHQGILDQHDQNQNDENPQITSTGKRRKMGSTRRLQPKKAISDQGATMEFDTTDVNMGNQKSFEGELNVISEPKYNTSNTTVNMDFTLIGSDSQSHDINKSHNEPMDTPVEVESLDNTNDDDVEKLLMSRVRDGEQTKDDKSETDMNMDSTLSNLLDEQDEDVTETTLREMKEVEQILDVTEEANALQSEKTPLMTLSKPNENKESFASQYHQGLDASDQFDIHSQDNTESIKVLTGAVGGASHSEDVGNDALLDQDSTVMASISKNVSERPQEENLGHGSDEVQKIDVDVSEVEKNVGDAIMVETSPAEHQLQFDPQKTSTGKRRKMGSTRRLQPKKAISDQGATMEFGTTDVNMRNEKSVEGELNVISEPIYNTSNTADNMDLTLIRSDSQSHDINTSHNEPMDTPVEVESLDNTNDDVEKSLSRVRHSEETIDDKSDTDSINMDSTVRNLLDKQDEDVTETTLRVEREVEERVVVIEEANALQSEKTLTLPRPNSEVKESFASQYHQGVEASDRFDIDLQDNTESMKDLTGAVGSASHSEDVGNNVLVDQDSTMASTTKNVRERPEEENLGHGSDEKQKIDMNVSEVEKNVGDAIMVETSPAEYQLQFDVECKYDESEEQREKPCEAVMDSSHLSDTKSHEEDYDKDSPDTAEHVSEHSWASKSDASDAHRGHQGILDQHDQSQNDENPQKRTTGKRRKMGSTRRLPPKKAISDQGATMEFDTTDVNMGNLKSFEGELNVIAEPIYNTSNTAGNMDLTLIGSDSQSHNINTSHNESMDTPVEVEPLDNTNDDGENLLIRGVRDSEETKEDKSETDNTNMDSTLSNLLGEQDEDVTETTLRVKREVEERLEVIDEANEPNDEIKESNTEDLSDTRRRRKMGSSRRNKRFAQKEEKQLEDVIAVQKQEVTKAELSVQEVNRASQGSNENAHVDPEKQKQLRLDVECKYDKSEEQREKPCEAVMDSSHLSDTKSHEEDYDKDSLDTAEHVSEHSLASKSDASDAHRGHQEILDQHDQSQNDENPQITSTGKRRKMGSTRRLQPKKAISDQGATMEFDTTDVNMRNQKSFEGGLNVISEPKYDTSNTTVNMDLTLIGSDSQSHDNKPHNEPMDTPVEVETLDNTNDDGENSLISGVRDSEETKDDKSQTDNINMDSTLSNLLGEQDEDVTETTLRVKREVEERLEVIDEANEPNDEIKESNTEDLSDTRRRRKMGSSRRNIRFAQKEEKQLEDVIAVQEQEVTKAELSVQKEVNRASRGRDENALDVEPLDNTNADVEKSSINTIRNSEETKYDEPKTDDINMDSTLRNVPGEQDEDVTETTLRLRVKRELVERLEAIDEGNVSQSENTEDLRDTRRRRKMGSSRRTQHKKEEKQSEDVIAVQEQAVTRAELSVQKEVNRASGDRDENALVDPEKQLQLDVECKYDKSEEQREKPGEAVSSHLSDSNVIPIVHPSHLGSEENPVSDGEYYTPSNPPSSPLNASMSERKRRKMGSNRKSRGQHPLGGPTEGRDKITNSTGDVQQLHNADEVLSSCDENVERSSSNTNRGHSSQEASDQVTGIKQRSPVGLQVHDKDKRHYMGNSKECDLGPRYDVAIVGNSYVGKTSFIKWVQNGTFSPDFSATIGIDTYKQCVTVNGKTVALTLWDTAGQERFRSITRQMFHRAQAFLLMYDITSSQSFSDVSYWLSCIQEGATEDVIIMLLGNKIDSEDREVHSPEGEALAKEYNIEFMECSAATGEHVTQSMETIARMLSHKFAAREEGMVLRKEPQQKKSSGCC